MVESSVQQFYREYTLGPLRQQPAGREPAAHHRIALDKLHQWFTGKPAPYHGGIRVFPTGGGKTFAAVRFLCTGPLSQGYVEECV